MPYAYFTNPGGRAMITAIILINVRRDAINETAEALTRVAGVAEVYSIAGQWDLVAVIRCKDNYQMADIVTNHMLKLSGIQHTQTLIAFRAYSKYDLERMFSIGLDEK
jgi:DNA-binding Lrp family transcriptional regulator